MIYNISHEKTNHKDGKKGTVNFENIVLNNNYSIPSHKL